MRQFIRNYLQQNLVREYRDTEENEELTKKCTLYEMYKLRCEKFVKIDISNTMHG